VYCFSYTTIIADEEGKTKKPYSKQLPGYHFYLLVLNGEYKEGAVPLLHSLIKKQFENRYTVTILSHRVQYIRKQSHNQKYFLNKVIENGLLAYSDTLHLVYPINTDEKRDVDFTKNYWKNRMMAAGQFLRVAEGCTRCEEALVKNALVQQAMQQVAMAQLDLLLSYHPNIYSINYLFYLLECIPEVKLPFTDSGQDRRLKQLLAANIDMIKHKDLKSESIEESNMIYEKCHAFYNSMYALGQIELLRLDNLNE
jgi:hypothetical protein